jgi:hypothetical protein
LNEDSRTGTYFGPQSEYDALGFQDQLARNATVKVSEAQDWLGVVGHWAEDEALKLIGGIVSRESLPRPCFQMLICPWLGLGFVQPAPFYSKSLAFTKDDLIPQSGIDKLFGYFDSNDKGTLVRPPGDAT